MLEIIASETFSNWLNDLKDSRGRGRIADRVERLAQGHYGDAKSVGEGVSELRLQFGPGYRVYFVRRGTKIIIRLCGGDKTTQIRDIERAKRLAKNWR